VKLTKITKGGKTVGAKVSLTYRAEGSATSGKLVLGRVEPGKWDGTNYRDAASGKTPGYVIGVVDEFKDLLASKPAERSFEIDYAKFGLMGGERLDLTSVWDLGSSLPGWAGINLHVWGMTRDGVGSMAVKLPE
jgi:hypothetical protein